MEVVTAKAHLLLAWNLVMQNSLLGVVSHLSLFFGIHTKEDIPNEILPNTLSCFFDAFRRKQAKLQKDGGLIWETLISVRETSVPFAVKQMLISTSAAAMIRYITIAARTAAAFSPQAIRVYDLENSNFLLI